ncbi:MAG: tRNA threonylcarbamoyladenosine dehydratase [Muribaculaceae bacterium]|nr:tRNA threonylcarbamoyladenosine dehydratase [Muribaculaceae bacterium]
MDRLNRIRMLLGDDAISKLQNATVMVVGCGAVGSFAIEALSRSGVGTLILVDFDTVATSNINRQLFALDSTVAQAKVDVARNRIHDINPDIIVHPINMCWDENTDIDARPNFVIDAIDDVAGKIALYKWCRGHNIPFISSMGAARKTDISQIRVGRISKTTVCPLAAKIRRLVRDTNIGDFPVVYSTEVANPNTAPNHTFGSIITVTGTFGLNMAQFVINEITK